MRPDTTAIDVAILPPPDVSNRAMALSAALPRGQSQGLLLGPAMLPHITLTQQFVSTDALDAVMAEVDGVVRAQAPLALRITGGGKGSNSVWMAVERTASLVDLHERLLHATASFELPNGDASAFADGDARERDIRWVQTFRRESSFARYTPHITLGHAAQPPFVEPMDFLATTIAVCALGRFCTCGHIIGRWDLLGQN
jgi:2'-5' RNA ligase